MLTVNNHAKTVKRSMNLHSPGPRTLLNSNSTPIAEPWEKLIIELQRRTPLCFDSNDQSRITKNWEPFLNYVRSTKYGQLSTAEQSEIIQALGLLSCLRSFKLEARKKLYCSSCDSKRYLRKPERSDSWREIFQVVADLTVVDAIANSEYLKVSLSLALRRILCHFLPPSVNSKDSCFEWIKSMFHGPSRDCRLAASRVLPFFIVRRGANSDLMQASMEYRVFEVVSRPKGSTAAECLTEASILAWGEIGRMSAGDDLNFVLIKLIISLASDDTFNAALAFHELKSLATANEISPWRLLSPFWHSISVLVLKEFDLNSRLLHLLSQLLGVSINNFLVRTQEYTIPYLILARKTSVIERMANIDGKTVFELCMANMYSILAVLLTQNFHDLLKVPMTYLIECSEKFARIPITSLIRADLIALSIEILKTYCEEDKGKPESEVTSFKAISLIADQDVKNLNTKPQQEMSNLDYFFYKNVLGIFSRFSDMLYNVHRRIQWTEKRRCLQGIAATIRFAKTNAVSAKPQICSCLQSALEDESLQEAALEAWMNMIQYFEKEEVCKLTPLTISMIVNSWEGLNASAKRAAKETLNLIVETIPIELTRLRASEIPTRVVIPDLKSFASKLTSLVKPVSDDQEWLADFNKRCQHENFCVVHESLLELRQYLLQNKFSFYSRPTLVPRGSTISDLHQTLLEICHRYTEHKTDIARLAAECLGLIGALEFGELRDHSEGMEMVVMSNFQSVDENVNFVLQFLEKCLVPSFRSSTDTKAQLFLAYVMQQLLKYSGLNSATITFAGGQQTYQKWLNLSEASKVTLTPFLTSRYDLNSSFSGLQKYPIFAKISDHRPWLQSFTLDLLCRVSNLLKTQSATKFSIDIFFVFSKVVNNQDISICDFLLPFLVQQIIVTGSDRDRSLILNEILSVLETYAGSNEFHRDDIRQSYQTVFSILDYSSRWQRAQRQQISTVKLALERKRNPDKALESRVVIERAEKSMVDTDNLMGKIPMEIVAARAFESHSYARALLYYEQHVRLVKSDGDADQMDGLYRKLQQIYTKLDDPDAIQGISVLLLSSDIEQQIVEHEAAGQWDLARSCYEVIIEEEKPNIALETRWMTCLRELNQYDNMLDRLNVIYAEESCSNDLSDVAIESSWILGKWEYLNTWLMKSSTQTFDFSIGKALLCIRNGDITGLYETISEARTLVANDIAVTNSLSTKANHVSVFRLHALSDLESLVMQSLTFRESYPSLGHYLQQRMESFNGSYREARFLLDLRRTTVDLMKPSFCHEDDLIVWLRKAKMARKLGMYDQAYSAVLNALKHSSPLAIIEHARIQWSQGQHRQALQKLQIVVQSDSLENLTDSAMSHETLPTSSSNENVGGENLMKAKAVLLYAKWFDQSNQSNWANVIRRYKDVDTHCHTFESGHYHIGRYYVKIVDAQKALQQEEQNKPFLTGEYHRSIVRAYSKAVNCGVKHIYQSLPKMLTVWLDFASEVFTFQGSASEMKDVLHSRARNLARMTTTINSCFHALPKHLLFTVLSQMISRICMPTAEVNETMSRAIISVAVEYPSQALWQILAISKSLDKERAVKGREILRNLHKTAVSVSGPKLLDVIKKATSLTEALVAFCHVRVSTLGEVDIKKLRDFSHCLPCELVVPVQANMTINWPSKWNQSPDYTVFSRKVTVYSIDSTAYVMNSLQRPKKIKIFGSDGSDYFILCKPKDDLRKDARMMEFNTMINMLLSKDNESSKRNLLILTYAVTVLNEDAGLIEWVSETRTLRDILRVAYASRNIPINFPELKTLLNTSKKPQLRQEIFETKILPMYPPVLYEWFIETFPTPTYWLESRTAFARTTAVMSIIGYLLGLGDRHCENILLHEVNGYALHVDFSCLFDKGLDLEVPELVPFRLTQNMVDALGPYGYDGPLRRCSEVTLRILRDSAEFLLPVLETFLHDPLLEWLSVKNPARKGSASSPEEALSRIDKRLKGILANDSFPLSIEAQTDSLLLTATDPGKLAGMYVGWCSFW
ncbi:hypothetical protein V1512DRAFT_225198 [Lipomyces arxii]|uniref:uncharacterized protein n=1 Tax=Lipomyces arxii TaxID=56418 RepID=UPI0034CD8A46